MTYTTPMTAAAGAIHTAAEWNSYVRDNFKALADAWTAFGSGANWTAVTTPPAIGNGTWDGKFIQLNKFVVFEAVITAGSTTTFGAGTYGLTLPVPALRATSRQLMIGSFFDTSASSTYPLWGMLSAGALTFRTLPTTAGNPFAAVTPTVPVTMASGDAIEVFGVYEAA